MHFSNYYTKKNLEHPFHFTLRYIYVDQILHINLAFPLLNLNK